jgi:hypothetical protein
VGRGGRFCGRSNGSRTALEHTEQVRVDDPIERAGPEDQRTVRRIAPDPHLLGALRRFHLDQEARVGDRVVLEVEEHLDAQIEQVGDPRIQFDQVHPAESGEEPALFRLARFEQAERAVDRHPRHLTGIVPEDAVIPVLLRAAQQLLAGFAADRRDRPVGRASVRPPAHRRDVSELQPA